MILVQNCRMIDPASQTDGLRDILIGEDRITKIAEAGTINPAQITKEKEDELRILNADGLIAAPGLVDTHVHFRDPGAEYKEDILTGAVSAAAGGVTSVVLMANTNPHVDQEETLSYVLEKGAKTGIHVYTCANVTMDMEGDELTDMEALAKAGAVGFTDDGKPLLDAKIARKAMQEAARVTNPSASMRKTRHIFKTMGSMPERRANISASAVRTGRRRSTWCAAICRLRWKRVRRS